MHFALNWNTQNTVDSDFRPESDASFIKAFGMWIFHNIATAATSGTSTLYVLRTTCVGIFNVAVERFVLWTFQREDVFTMCAWVSFVYSVNMAEWTNINKWIKLAESGPL